ncbi:MAG: NAD(+) diphosphatase [Alphaproteobacteria bacterium]|nr:NAD(+) diphosphatase [Alphaproteobacteria bacterium]
MSSSVICAFSAEPLERASAARMNAEWIAARLADPESLLLPLYRGDPLIRENGIAFLSAAARAEFRDAPLVFLGLSGERAVFAVDASAAPSPEAAPFADIGRYLPLREAADALSDREIAIAGHARWLFDWHRRHLFCANCGAPTAVADGGAKRLCTKCQSEHFPRSDPVAIVLAVHEDHCLLGRSPRFPPGFLSALAGFVEAAETPEACAVRELREEAGVVLTDVRYQFSQPWPFPSSLMMGFIADAKDRALTLDRKEIEEARWLSRSEIAALLGGEQVSDVRLPPRFTIARRLIERWAQDGEDR